MLSNVNKELKSVILRLKGSITKVLRPSDLIYSFNMSFGVQSVLTIIAYSRGIFHHSKNILIRALLATRQRPLFLKGPSGPPMPPYYQKKIPQGPFCGTLSITSFSRTQRALAKHPSATIFLQGPKMPFKCRPFETVRTDRTRFFWFWKKWYWLSIWNQNVAILFLDKKIIFSKTHFI